ncbi:MAG: hypothetical protein JXQ71_14115 [Verrucomicrobia bacterium]|nr:hypothetical protein [Verrucomicrobiota bacterium]
MNRLSQLIAMAGVTAALGLSTVQVNAQGRGGFDPEQMRARMMERYKDALEVSNDAEWKIIEPRINKVMETRRDVGFGFGFGRGFMMSRRPGGEGGDRQRGPERQANPEAEALQKAIEAKAPADEIKTKLAAFRDARQKKQEAVEAAQADLKKVLSVRQEAILVGMGVLQ